MKIPLKSFGPFLMILVCCLLANAQEGDSFSPAYHACKAGAELKQDRNEWATAMTKCVKAETENQNARLNHNLKHNLGLADSGEQAKIHQRQAQFIADRDRTCAAEGNKKDSLLGNLLVAVCEIDQDAARADKLARNGIALAKKHAEQH